MPVTWDQATFDSVYRVRIRDPAHPDHGDLVNRWKHYSREGMTRLFDPYLQNPGVMVGYERRWANLTSRVTIPTTDRILVVGCAFGWLIEAAKAAGWPNVYGIDNSPHISNVAGTPGQTEVAGGTVLVQEDFTGGGAVRNALRQATGDDEFHWLICEDVDSSFSDAEITGVVVPTLESALYSSEPESQIVHLVSCKHGGIDGNPLVYWRTLAEHALLAPTHTWIDIVTWEIAS
jgi:hypothetical protein